eukprot:Amastigsp_a220_54.p3 type:complete len:110 gc:universal Amastigsp_a220_54:245-574(+)
MTSRLNDSVLRNCRPRAGPSELQLRPRWTILLKITRARRRSTKPSMDQVSGHEAGLGSTCKVHDRDDVLAMFEGATRRRGARGALRRTISPRCRVPPSTLRSGECHRAR